MMSFSVKEVAYLDESGAEMFQVVIWRRRPDGEEYVIGTPAKALPNAGTAKHVADGVRFAFEYGVSIGLAEAEDECAEAISSIPFEVTR
jgi:hypothetical protein